MVAASGYWQIIDNMQPVTPEEGRRLLSERLAEAGFLTHRAANVV
jgi:hypothetical protein